MVCTSFLGGFGVCWVLWEPDLGSLPLLVGMGDPWISGCCVWAGSGHWSRVGTLNIMHSGVPLCLATVGFLPLAMVEAGGQMGALGAGSPRVYLWWWGPCLVGLRGLVGTGVSWQGWRLDFLRLTDTHRVLLNFVLLSYFFLVPYSVFLYIYFL